MDNLMNFDELLAEMDKRDRERPRIVKIWRAIRFWFKNWPHRIRDFREFFIRGRHGWAPSDTWSLDHYLAGVMGHSLEYLADHNHGWPGTDEWKTPEEWEAELRKQAAILITYSTNYDFRRPDEVTRAIKRLASYWGHLWD
jgi:hypothetical protein